ncbi:tetratricopeptide repeat protein [Rhodocyclus tenuis]|uniref:tetratricopeptide repeat protein n=1 Tax=Rhodocyclus tenuis TaxID=1066 RepID=UPI0019050636|nr:tetratricopeptide repeat protein [Rhodocyclus tenuis]MBK1681448.1 hypothetical protein [Rhodocyclus tenuis]
MPNHSPGNRLHYPRTLKLSATENGGTSGGPENPKAALEYTRKSAEAGYPTGQFNLYVYYSNGAIIEKNETEALVWLKKAAEQNFFAALFRLAELNRDGLIDGSSPAVAEELFSRCMNLAGSDSHLQNAAALQYAWLLSRSSENIARLTRAAVVPQRCYEDEGGAGDIAKACADISIGLVGRIRDLIRAHKGTAEEIVVAEFHVRYMFENDGKPVLSRSAGLDAYSRELGKAVVAKARLSPQLYQEYLMKTLNPELSKTLALGTVGVAARRVKVGRNEKCICGSGRKSKLCCGR